MNVDGSRLEWPGWELFGMVESGWQLKLVCNWENFLIEKLFSSFCYKTR